MDNDILGFFLFWLFVWCCYTFSIAEWYELKQPTHWEYVNVVIGFIICGPFMWLAGIVFAVYFFVKRVLNNARD